MTESDLRGLGTLQSPWLLTTPSGRSKFQAYRDESLDPPALVVMVGKTELRYHLRCLEDLHAMLKSHGDWMVLGNADEQKPVAEGTVEAWARSSAFKDYYEGLVAIQSRFISYLDASDQHDLNLVTG